MLSLSRPAVVRTDCCPAITECDDLSAAPTDYRLDGEAHPRLHGSWVGVTTGVDVRRSVEISPNAVACEGWHHCQTLLTHVVLDGGPCREIFLVDLRQSKSGVKWQKHFKFLFKGSHLTFYIEPEY